MNYLPQPPRPTFLWLRHLGGFFTLAAIILILHGRSLHYGLMLDDYPHYSQLRSCGWSLRELVDACRLELVGPIIDYWWMPDVTLRFFRPVSFVLMKLVYTLSSWNPVAMHLASLGWHLASATLLVALIRRLGGSLPAAWGIAAMFAMHPAHVATVQWLASQTELIVTTFVLIALICYGGLRPWPVAFDASESKQVPRGRAYWGRFGGACICFAAALGCRENAIMLPLVLLASEPLWSRLLQREKAAGESTGRTGRLRGTTALILALVVIAGIYVCVRTYYLGGVAVPPRPYIVPPSAPDFPRYALDKLCYYLLGEFFLVPCIPIGGLAFFREHLLVLYGLAALAAAGMIWLTYRQRRSTLGWLAPACLLGFMTPLIPAYEAPHHLYLPGIGWALYVLIGWQEFAQLIQRVRPARARILRAGATILAAGTAAIFGIASHLFGQTIEAAAVVEDQVLLEMVAAPIPLKSGDTIYFANLPLLDHYLKLMLEQRLELHDLHVRALTWSPRLTGVSSPAELTIVDDRTIEVRIANAAYFDGPLGLMVRETNGGRMPFTVGQPAQGRGFTATPLAADENGVQALRFVFDQPLDSPGVHLYWGSATRWAYQVPAAQLHRQEEGHGSRHD